MGELKRSFKEKTGGEVREEDMELLRGEARQLVAERMAREEAEERVRNSDAQQNEVVARMRRDAEAGIVRPEEFVPVDAGEGIPEKDGKADERTADEIAKDYLKELEGRG